jgi:hypothetical protein
MPIQFLNTNGRGGFTLKNNSGAGRFSMSIANTIDTDAQAFFSRVTAAGGTLSGTEQTAITNLVVSLKANGVWADMKAIYPMVGASAAACAQNLKSSSFTGTFSGGWTFASTGATPNGTNAYMDTQLSPSANLGLFNTHISTYIRTFSGGILMGVDVVYRLWMAVGSNRAVPINTGATLVNTTGSTALGLWTGTRIVSTSADLYNNNAVSFTAVENVAGLDTNNIYLACRNGAPASVFSSSEIAFSSIGDGLDSTKVSNLYTVVQAFQTSLSRQV